jgi:hypothetical protein
MVPVDTQENALRLPEIPLPDVQFLWVFNFESIPLEIMVHQRGEVFVDEAGKEQEGEPTFLKIGEIPLQNAAMVRRVVNTDDLVMLEQTRPLMWVVEPEFYDPGAMIIPDAVKSIQEMMEDAPLGFTIQNEQVKGVVRSDSPLYYNRTRGYNPPLYVPIWDTVNRAINHPIFAGPMVGEPPSMIVEEVEDSEPVYGR